ncbi:hypothetical protein F2Q68_00014787 [Brassica cretica]|uniref:Uncharacterized protein n=1 Tax=Brassica cretica TaxID=69181 RepID=A0A8S9HM30_BRACR|nr:hypothetical protein F2Q68_00014787 [Brassica cretica]
MQEAKPESHHDAPSHTIVPLHSSGRVAQVPSPSTAHFTRCRHPLETGLSNSISIWLRVKRFGSELTGLTIDQAD